MPKTGVELINDIAECSARIARKQRDGKDTYWEEIRRAELRQDLAKLPELSFS